MASQSKRKSENKMYEIETDKNQIRKYIRLLIKKIEIISTDNKSTLLAIYKRDRADNKTGVSDSNFLTDFLLIKKTNRKYLTLKILSFNYIIQNEPSTTMLKVQFIRLINELKKGERTDIINQPINYKRFDNELYENDIPKR